MIFILEQYELHVSRTRVTADTAAEAIIAIEEGDPCGYVNFSEVDEEVGMPIEGNEDLADQLKSLGMKLGDGFIPSIRSVQEDREGASRSD